MDKRAGFMTYNILRQPSAVPSHAKESMSCRRPSLNPNTTFSRGLQRTKIPASVDNESTISSLWLPHIVMAGLIAQFIMCVIGLIIIRPDTTGCDIVIIIHLFICISHITLYLAIRSSKIGATISTYRHWLDFLFLSLEAIILVAGLSVYTISGSRFYMVNIMCNTACNNLDGVTSSSTCTQSTFSNGTYMCDANTIAEYQTLLNSISISSWVLNVYLLVQIPGIHLGVTLVSEHLQSNRLFPQSTE
ncbi:hypothetical protein BASA83_006996 [Batrachochytrium salamandrivorans]|nr:hypothetical protein BASA83_006996 [Batrachochytrium salamandrivorans]